MQKFILAALGLTVVVLSALPLFSAGERNRGSLRFWGAHRDGAGEGGRPSGLLDEHTRAGLWQAALALQAGEWQTVLDQALPLAAAGDILAMEYAAAAYEALGLYDPAVALWQQSGNLEALMQLGQAAHRGGLLDTALAAYTAAWDIDPRLATARLVLVLKDLERPEGAVQIYRRSLEQVGRYDRRIPGWNRGLARLYAEQERWVEAVSAYETALAAAGYDPAFEVETVYYEIAWAYRMAGRLAEAVEAIETAIALNPSGEVQLRAGQIYEAAGSPEAALAAYRLALEALPESKPALEGVERLEAGE